MLSEARETYNKLIGKKEALDERLLATESAIQRLSRRSMTIDKGQAILQLTAKETQEKLQYHIEDVVQGALDTCFPGKYDFKVEFVIKRGKTEANLFLENENGTIDPKDSTGGGIVDMIAFTLRMAAWTLSKTDPFLLFDEPFKFLSANLRPLAAEIMKKLFKKLKVQALIITHDPIMVDVGDKIFEVDQKHGVSYLK